MGTDLAANHDGVQGGADHLRAHLRRCGRLLPRCLNAMVLIVGVAAKPAEAWRPGSVPVFSFTDFTGLLLLGLVAGSLAVATLHVWLLWYPRTTPRSAG